MSPDMEVLLGMLIGGTVGMVVVLVLMVCAVKFKWIDRIERWLDL